MSYNIFNQAHTPLKLALLSTCIFLDEKSPVTVSNAGEAIKKANEVIKIFKAQVEYENLYVLPLVFEYEPSIWDIYVRQHKKLSRLAQTIEELIELFREDGSQRVLQLIAETFNEFVLMNYHHMDDEEETLNEILWRYYTDDSLRQLDQQLKMQSLLVVQHEAKAIYSTATAA